MMDTVAGTRIHVMMDAAIDIVIGGLVQGLMQRLL